MLKLTHTLKAGALALVAGLSLAGGAVAAPPAAPAPAPDVTEQVSTHMVGPYWNYDVALDAADYLEDLGFYTNVFYRNGYWWVKYW